jgi:soluble lytic murein transglycosylase-like protein
MGLSLAGVPLLVGGTAHAASDATAPTDAAKYLSLCRKYGVASGKDVLATDKAYELRGVVSGIAESSDSYNLLLRSADGATMNLAGSGPAPALGVNATVRILVDGASAGSSPSILAVVTEGDAALAQESQRIAAAKKSGKKASVRSGARKGRSVVPLASRSLTTPRVPVTTPEETLAAYKKAIRYFNPNGSEEEIDTIARAVLRYSIQYQVDARLVMAVFAVESGFKSDATSHSGAMGIGQLMPGTAADLGVDDAYDPVQNIEGAIKYLRRELDRYQGKDEWTRLQLVLASYNAGPNAVKKYQGVPPYRETQNYVRKVSAWYLRFIGVR